MLLYKIRKYTSYKTLPSFFTLFIVSFGTENSLLLIHELLWTRPLPNFSNYYKDLNLLFSRLASFKTKDTGLVESPPVQLFSFLKSSRLFIWRRFFLKIASCGNSSIQDLVNDHLTALSLV